MGRRVCFLVSLTLLVPVSASAQRQTKMAFVSVVDSTGSPVSNLTAEDFNVSVGGVKQVVTRVAFSPPIRIVLLVDASEPVTNLLTSFRAGLNAFVDTLPPDDEIALLSIGGQLRIRQAPTTDRKKLHEAANNFRSDGGSNPFLDSLLESDKRFLKNAPDRWPVFAILTTDEQGMMGGENVEAFNAFVHDFVARGGSAHALVLHGRNTGLISDLAQNLVENTGGLHEGLSISNSLPERMKAVAARIAADHRAMANRYEIQYRGSGNAIQPVEVRIDREGLTIQVSSHRPF